MLSPGKQVVRLKDKADLLVAYVCQLLTTHPADILACQTVTAAGWPVEASKDVHQG
jgi:hypothetical protein